MLTNSEAIFAVADVPATVKFYREVLGFESEWLWGNPPTFGGVRWGKAHVMLCQQPNLQPKIEGHMHFFQTDQVQSLYERHKAAGAKIVSDIENKPWGMREYTVRDLNGYHLRFAGPEKYEKPKTAVDALPNFILIAKRTPTLEEYGRLFESVGWVKLEASMAAQVLQRSLFCVIATDARDGQTVGMARACGDGKYFTIWDVIVIPSHQSQKIGSALLETTISELRKIGPKGGFVGLFTGKPEFYERCGFRKDNGMHLAL